MCDICDAKARGLTEEQAKDQYMKNALDTISLYGLALTGVADADPPFVYSTGRTLIELPELFMTGWADIRYFAGTINQVHHAQINDGLHVHDGDLLEGFMQGDLKLAVRRADPVKAEMNFGMAMFASQGLTMTAWQLVWPDPEGRYPWDDGYDQELLPQPLYPVG